MGGVISLTPKEDDGIRMVYDGTSSGLNNALLYSHFSLHTVGNNLGAI